MAVIVFSDVEGQSMQGYDAMLEMLDEALRRAPGFVMHMSYPVQAGWRIVEVWNTKEEAAQFFAAQVAPKLPKGVRPKLSFHCLHSLLKNREGPHD